MPLVSSKEKNTIVWFLFYDVSELFGAFGVRRLVGLSTD